MLANFYQWPLSVHEHVGMQMLQKYLFTNPTTGDRTRTHYQELSYYRNCHSGYRYSNLDRFRLIPFDWRPVSVVLPV